MKNKTIKVAENLTSVFILSDKSSGSSILQNELCKHEDVNVIYKTPHEENETLYWLKASVLSGLPQNKLVYSGFALTKEAAKDSIITLLQNNIPGYQAPLNDEELVFGGWEQLCKQFKPVFLEKSPHHLLSPSALQLMFECPQRLPNITFKYIGLIRNPMDTIYSYWKRWHVDPVKKEDEWLQAYKTLRLLKEKYSDEVLLIKYEDLVNDKEQFKTICNFIGIKWEEEIGKGVHQRSVSKWRTDNYFGFNLNRKTIELALLHGYREEELINMKKNQLLWLLNRIVNRRTHRYNINKRRIKMQLKKLLKR